MPKLHVDESARLELLADYGVMDTPPDATLDEIVALAAAICGMPIALVSLVDDKRQWFKARHGLAATQTPRDQAFCAHAIAADSDDLFTVTDARKDPRFERNPLVTGDPHIVFYAGAPLDAEGGARLGALCVIASEPRTLTSMQATALKTLSKVVVRHLQAVRADAERAKLHRETDAARETAETANRTMDQFLATVSHELRTPLNAMLGWTRLLRGNQLPDDQRGKALATIERNGVAQAQLIEDLLDVSRIISGSMRLELMPVDLVRVVEAAQEAMRASAIAKGVQLRSLLDETAMHVTGDAARLQQVVWNLLSNAVKFTPKGGRVDIRLDRVGANVELSVTDSGSGIPIEFLTHVFERFRQADGSSNRSHGGLGLGLAIVKSVADLHGGSVRAESEGSGRGSRFVLTLPLLHRMPESVDRVAVPAASESSSDLESPAELRGLRVLVVDDETDARELMVTMLARSGAIVSAASSVSEAMTALAAQTYSVVISDLGMPHEDGYSLIKRIRTLPARYGGKVPVVALTAYARAEDRTKALRAGFNTHVAKPVNPVELFAVIASLVERANDALY